MSKITRMIILKTTFLAVLTHVRSPAGPLLLIASYFKMLATAISPFLALFGIMTAIVGLARRDRLATFGSIVTAAFSLHYVARVTEPHNKFERAFGPAWRSRIPPTMMAHMRPHRFTLQPLLPSPVPWEKNVVIGIHAETGDPLLADMWRPPADVRRTELAILYLHGSAWHYLDKDVNTRPFFRHLAGQGHVVLDVAYTLAPKAGLVGVVADVKRAIAWLKQNPQHEINPERIVLMGASAGAHLALLAAYTPGHSEFDPPDIEGVDTSVRGVVSYYGFGDLAQAHHYLQRLPRVRASQRSAAEKLLHRLSVLPADSPFIDPADTVISLLGGTPDEVPAMYHLGSPINHVGPHCPPTLLLNGQHDLGVEESQHRELHRALVNAGIVAMHVEFPYTEHAFDMSFPQIAPAAQAATYDTERFLALLM